MIGIHIDHGITSATTFQTGQIVITTFTNDACTTYCSAFSDTNSVEIGTTNICKCDDGFKWDNILKKCNVTCASIPYAIASNDTVCACVAGYVWNTTQSLCVRNCSDIEYAGVGSLSPLDNNVCVCNTS